LAVIAWGAQNWSIWHVKISFEHLEVDLTCRKWCVAPPDGFASPRIFMHYAGDQRSLGSTDAPPVDLAPGEE
jgi:hypothetical protein